MNPIKAPIAIKDRGGAVADLQDCLVFLLRKATAFIPDSDRAALTAGVKSEQATQTYSDFTAKAVSLFQQGTQAQFYLKATGDVDAATADALNTTLKQLGAFDTPPAPPAPASNPPPTVSFIVRGQVFGGTDQPQVGIAISAFDRDLGGISDRLGDPAQATVTDAQGRFSISYTSDQFMRGDKDTPDLTFQVGSVAPIQFDAPPPAPATPPPQIVRVRRLPVDGDSILNAPADLSGDDLILGIEARLVEEVQIFLTGTTRGLSEFDQVLQALRPVLLDRSPALLDEAKFRDITFAAREVGLDRELVECLVVAHQLSQTEGFSGVPPGTFYGLARYKQIKTLARIASGTVVELTTALMAASGADLNYIPAFDSPAAIDAVVALLHPLTVAHSIQLVPVSGLASITQVLTKVLPSVDEQTSLVSGFANHSGPTPRFWDNLASNPAFQAPGKIPAIQFGLQVGALAEGRPGLIDAIHGAGEYKSMRDLALNTEDLPGLAKNVALEHLADFPGATQEAKSAYYAVHLQGVLQAAFPTETVAKTLEGTDFSPATKSRFQSTAAVLKQASVPESFPLGDHFDIRTTHIDTFVGKYKDTLLPGLSADQLAQAVADLKQTQRVFRVSASPQSFSVLMKHGFGSAQSIAKIPPSSFVSQFGPKLGSDDIAMLVHGRATTASLTGTFVAIQTWQAYADAKPMAAGGGIKVLPSWAQMFGSADVCECEECNSVFGPAAYFVDLLQFLGNSTPNAQGFTPLDYLIGKEDDAGSTLLQGRRPDLAYLALSCTNTNTTLPYIDLVNEVLESYIVHQKADKAAAHDVGNLTVDELLANPQYVDEAAYDALRTALYPPSLPFDRSLESIRQHLGQLQTSLLTLRRTFAASPDEWSPAIVAEKLGFSAREYSIVSGKNFDGSDAGITAEALYGFIPAAAPGPPESLGEQVGPVRVFLARAGLSYQELIEVVTARFSNPAQAQLRLLETVGLTADELATIESTNFATIPVTAQQKLTAANHTVAELRQWLAALDGLIVLFSPASDCDLDNTWLQFRSKRPLDDVSLLNIHRFIRIWRKLGWSVSDLDAAVVARRFSADPVVALRDLAQVKELGEQTGLAVRELLDLWGNIDTFGPTSLYRKLFENVALSTSPNPAFALNATEDEVDGYWRGTPSLLADNLPAVAAGLRLRDQEVASIAAAAALPPDAPLNIANLSTLFRHALLARGLGIPLRLLIELNNLTDPLSNPFTGPAATLRFVALVRKVQAATTTAPQLAYWCRHDDPGGIQDAAATGRATDLNNRLVIGLSRARDERASLLGEDSAGPTADQTRDKLAEVGMSPADLPVAADIVEAVSKLTPEDQKTFIAKPGTFNLFMDPQVAIVALSGPVDADPTKRDDELSARRRSILAPLLAYLDSQMVKGMVAETLGITGDAVDGLLTQSRVLASVRDASQPILSDFTGLTPLLSADRLNAFLRLSLATSIVNAFRLTMEEVTYFTTHLGDFGNYDLNKLPTAPADGKAVFAFINALLDYTALRDAVGQRSIPFIQCFTAQTETQRTTAVSLLTGAAEGEVRGAYAQLPLPASALVETANLASVIALLRLSQATGVAAAQLKEWSGEPSSSVNSAIRKTLKARFDDASWLMIGRAISDTLRESQRSALVALMLTLPPIQAAGITTANQIFEHLLIDVQMMPVMQTSRIIQAIAAVQLFVDRCFMNLEGAVSPSAIDADQWAWRQRYRVSEANKRVFVNPENFLETELRDDKSPFFRDLESELLQGDLSDPAAQHALIGYLKKVSEVARLETCAHFLEQDPLRPDQTTLHLIARTPGGAPRVYYYRQLINDSSWTSWEQVDLDIDGPEDGDNTGVQLVPVVWRQRLFLFWTTLTKKSDSPSYPTIDFKTSVTPRNGEAYLEVKVLWSTYEHGKWTKKRIASAAATYSQG